MKMTGAQIILECLKREGVQHIFGYPGGAVIDLYDELSRCPEIKHYLVRHEQAAVHAADGYARASNKVGVALVTSGPGATNTVTGIAEANEPLGGLAHRAAWRRPGAAQGAAACESIGSQINGVTQINAQINGITVTFT